MPRYRARETVVALRVERVERCDGYSVATFADGHPPRPFGSATSFPYAAKGWFYVIHANGRYELMPPGEFHERFEVDDG